MTSPISQLSFTGAQVLRGGQIAAGDITVTGGYVSDDPAAANTQLDLTDYYVLPGIIDLHGDAFEHHIAPRPTAPFPISLGLAGTDRDAAANGVTTAWMAQSWSWEGGTRGPDFAETFLAAHQAYKALMLTDLRVQIRCETHTVDTQDRLIAAIRTYGIDYVIFNNHLDEAVDMARTHPERAAHWAARTGRSLAAHMALVAAAQDLTPQVPRHLCNLASAFDSLGVRYGSHDDADGRTREYYAMIGAKICEFPTHRSAAALAKTWRDPVIMGAPNVVRGGSQAGNIAASTLIRDGLCDVLVSDYHYPTLAQAAFVLADTGVIDLAQAWAMISANPARIMGLKDRGTLAAGRRADLVIVNAQTRQIEGTMVAGCWSYLAAGVAHRLCQTHQDFRLAAE